jgi:hypothetical protein
MLQAMNPWPEDRVERLARLRDFPLGKTYCKLPKDLVY